MIIRTNNMRLLVLLVMWISPSLAQDVSCPEGMEVFVLDYESLAEMRQDAEMAVEAGDSDAMPFFDVQLSPNNYEYSYEQSLAAFRNSGTFLWLRGWDSYHIQASKRVNKFLLKFVVVETRFVRKPLVEFYVRPEGERFLHEMYLDKIEPEAKTLYSRSVFPRPQSDLTFYSTNVPYYLDKIRIAFRTTAGGNQFGVQNIQVVTCISGKVV